MEAGLHVILNIIKARFFLSWGLVMISMVQPELLVFYRELVHYKRARESKCILSQVFSWLKSLKQKYVHCHCKEKTKEYIFNGGYFL